MMLNDLLLYFGGILLGIIGYFLKSTMDDLKSLKIMSFETKNKLAIIENDYLNKHNNLTDKFDELKLALNELTKELKELNKRG